MNKLRFEKFEMKYGYLLPEEYKYIISTFGGDLQLGSCRFEYPDKIINNLLRVPGKMDFGIIPFGDIGNGDYYCFYRYGFEYDKYFVGIWLNETRNFVILASNFKSFLYKCVLDEYLSNILPENETDNINSSYMNENIKITTKVCVEMGFDQERLKGIESEFDYHRLMIENDGKAVQSLCYIGKELLKRKDKNALDFLNAAKDTYPFYTAPYYIKGTHLRNNNKPSNEVFLEGLKTSLSLTGYSYWEEDFIDIPDFVHREMSLYVSETLENSIDYFEKQIFLGEDVYNYVFRYNLANYYREYHKDILAINEYNNAVFCCNDKTVVKEILKDALEFSIESGLIYLQNIIEHDIRLIR